MQDAVANRTRTISNRGQEYVLIEENCVSKFVTILTFAKKVDEHSPSPLLLQITYYDFDSGGTIEYDSIVLTEKCILEASKFYGIQFETEE